MDEITVVVEPGAELPQLGKPFMVGSLLTGRKYAVKVKAIKSLRWHSNGNLIVEITGAKTVVEGDK